MDIIQNVNQVELRGTVSHAPEFSHESRGIEFYRFPLEIQRLSGAADTVNIIARKELLDALELDGQPKIYVSGELRSFNNKSGRGSRLVITVFARALVFDDGDDINIVRLHGTLCKLPSLRTTPLGRDICDLMVAVNRRYGRSDYLPCIAWGLKAREASGWPIGTSVVLEGRIQSRRYIKNTDDGAVEKIAYEVSVAELEAF